MLCTVEHFRPDARELIPGNGWNNTSVAVSFTCSDAGSDIASCTPPVTVETEGGDQSVTGTAADNAGNSASTTVSGINIDLTPPTITATRTAPNSDGWNNGPVTVTFSCSDTPSGIDTCPEPVTLTGEGAGQSVTGTAYDNAGNETTLTFGDINIDRNGPLTTVDTPQIPIKVTALGDTVTGTAIDSLSGPRGTIVTFEDAAGNTIPGSADCISGCGTTITRWSIDTSRLIPGIYTVYAWSSDHASNLGANSPAVLLVVV